MNTYLIMYNGYAPANDNAVQAESPEQAIDKWLIKHNGSADGISAHLQAAEVDKDRTVDEANDLIEWLDKERDSLIDEVAELRSTD